MTEITTKGRIEQDGWYAESVHGFLRRRLATVAMVNPVDILREGSARLIALAEFREKHVQAAWAHVQTSGAITFPEGFRTETVFNTGGPWGQWASTALDSQIRGEYFHLLSMLDHTVGLFSTSPDYVDLSELPLQAIWTRADLAYALIREKRKIFASNTLEYVNSVGAKVPLSLLDLERRLYDLSFDPNHPPELRWGAGLTSEEARTAIAMATPLPNSELVPMPEAYKRQAYYRTLSHWDTDQSYLQAMMTEGFPVQTKFDDYLAMWFSRDRSPRLVPTRAAAPRARSHARATSISIP